MSNSAIDFNELLNRVDNDRQLLSEILSIFKNEFPSNLARLSDAVTRGDLKEIAMLSHTFKGTLGNLAAAKAMNWAAHLEQVARAGDAAQLRTAFIDFEHSVSAILSELEAYLTEAHPA